MCSKVSKEVDANMDLDQDCRLTVGLNTDCLVEVFKKLPVNDLITLSVSNEYFKQVIHNYVIHKKQIDFKEKSKVPYSTILGLFGNRIRNLRFTGNSHEFDRFLNQITQYCSGNKLEKVEAAILHLRNDKNKWELGHLRRARNLFPKIIFRHNFPFDWGRKKRSESDKNKYGALDNISVPSSSQLYPLWKMYPFVRIAPLIVLDSALNLTTIDFVATNTNTGFLLHLFRKHSTVSSLRYNDSDGVTRKRIKNTE